MGAWVCMLRCADGSYYVGTTRASLEERMAQHQSGVFGGDTALRRPAALVCSESFDRIEDAIRAERKLKGWSRAKKEALVAGRLDDLSALAARRTALAAHPSRRAFGPPQDEGGEKPA